MVHDRPATRTQSTFCRICEPHCPLVAELDADNTIIHLASDRDHPAGGAACHKGLSFLDIHNDPDRLDWPLKRQNAKASPTGAFARIGWDQALDEIGAKLRAIRAEHGPGAVAFYQGNPFALGSSTATAFMGAIVESLETPMLFSSNTQDASNKVAGAAAIYGSAASLMVPDLLNTDYLLCLGANPRVSRWTIASVPNDDIAILKGIRARGGKIRFVNPRRIESSTVETGPTLLIRPGADAYFLAALLHEIDRRGRLDEAMLATHGRNVAQMRDFVRLYPPERVAEVTGIDAATIRQVADELLAAPSAAVYMGTGLNQSGQGLLCHWLVEMINFATGNLGRKGGTYKPTGLFADASPTGETLRVETSLGAFELPRPLGYGVLPAALLPALIENGDVRALIVLGGNPVLSVGGEEGLRRAAAKLDLMVSFDIYPQATGELADYMLPSTDWLEHVDTNFLISGFQMKPYVQYTDAVVAPLAERRNGWWLLARLCQLIGVPSPLDDDPEARDGDAMVAGMLAARGLTIEQMRMMPSNSVLLEPEPHDALFARNLRHPDRKVDCLPASYVAKGLFDRCHAMFEELAQEPADALRLISLRTRYMHNSWLTNQRKLRRGDNAANPLHISESDARQRGLHDGDAITVSNDHGSIDALVRIDPDLGPGVVAMTHGYGNRLSRGLGEAGRKPGTNCNAVMPVDPDSVEPISYMSRISAVPVRIDLILAAE